jgi:hypothetical protein
MLRRWASLLAPTRGKAGQGFDWRKRKQLVTVEEKVVAHMALHESWLAQGFAGTRCIHLRREQLYCCFEIFLLEASLVMEEEKVDWAVQRT